MSTPDPNDLRDPRFDAAWRTASNEEPPATLDDAIRAAARREVSAGPQSMPRASSRSALSPQRWWAPLAAAATIGAIAIGVLQLASPDKVVAPASDKAVVSDMPAPASSVGAPAPPPAITAPPAEQPASASPGNADERAARPPAAPAPAPAAPAAKRASAPPTLRKDAAVPFPAKQEAAADAEADAAKTTTERQREVDTLDAAKPASAAEPFPADAVKREAKEDSTRKAAPAAPSANAVGAGLASGKLATPPAQAAREEARGDAALTSRPTPRMQQSNVARQRADGTAPGTRAKVAPKLAVPDWIALIRRLRDEGNTDEAAKELAAFRAAYPDPDGLLPPDLRNWKPTAR